ncbi:BTAD domain-containing putative transcriptional regulator [Nonomuraea sp. KM90]|uniref:BTAD domain-containing putative transcriptional regulator n=1 Tax=Nonomuraea sp. KM90 TaxID=3457428 RepID=UPI003FCCACC2
MRDQVIDLGPPQRRAVWAALAVDAGRPVSVPTLVGRVWGEFIPAEARSAVYAHITRIRRLLTAAEKADGVRMSLERHAGGYLLDVDPDRVDLLRFRRLAELALDKSLDDRARVALLREALGLWRGRLLEGVDGAWAEWARAHFGLYRVEAVVAWARLEVDLGNHERVIPQVHALISEYPLAEPLAAGLMRALHAAGRNAEALEVFATTRRRLVEELGTEPGSELCSIYQSVLRGELDGGAAPAVSPASLQRARPSVARPRSAAGLRPASPPPCTLPAGIPDLTGREDAIAELEQQCQRGGPSGGRAMVVLSGAAGAGKTAVAVHVAHRLRAAFPHGQLYLHLAGLSAPRTPADAMGQLLRALGVPRGALPRDIDERSALLRSLTVDRRYLFVLDDAADEAQVRPLLPGAGSAVLITSRRPLSGLEGAHRLALGSFSDDEALRLLGSVIGVERLACEPAQAADIVRYSAGLPLAVRAVASRIQTRPERRLAAVAAELAGSNRRLDLLASGDLDVRASIGLSYRALPPDSRRALRKVSMLPLGDVPVWAFGAAAPQEVTANAGTADGGRRRSGDRTAVADRGAFIVDDLMGLHMIGSAGLDETGWPCYRLDDLVRAYAWERAFEEDEEADRWAGSLWGSRAGITCST